MSIIVLSFYIMIELANKVRSGFVLELRQIFSYKLCVNKVGIDI